MASVAQIEANRLNAQKSTGPRTPEGKAKASQNAVKHGLLAEQVVIHGEDPAEFDGYRDRMLRELAPVGEVETMLAERAVSLAWRLRRAERLQSAVFARVYRENADDVVLWPKHGLPIQPGPDEEEVVLGQVVMTDFGQAQVLDRLLVYERRIEGSFYRTMAELRRERQARMAVREADAVQVQLGSFDAARDRGTPASQGEENHGRDARATAGPVELGSFDAEATRTAGGVTTNGSYGQDACATKDHGQDARATEGPGELGSFGVEAERTAYGVTAKSCRHSRDVPEAPVGKDRAKRTQLRGGEGRARLG